MSYPCIPTIGVADGVGSWLERGIDPSFFSRELMESCYRVSARESVDLKKPVQILARALSEVQLVHSKFYGKSACDAPLMESIALGVGVVTGVC